MADEREGKLPQWAQQLIAQLRVRANAGSEPLMQEVAKLRPRVQLLERRLGAMEELLTCAANGGHKTAAEVMEVLRSYSLTLTKDE